MRHDDPGLEQADLLRSHAEQHEVGVVMDKTAVTVHHVGDLLLGAPWVHFVSEEVSLREPGETTLHVPGDNDLQNQTSPSRRYL